MNSYPLKYYTDKGKNPLLFHVLDVGGGLMLLLIFPDQTVMLYDCNVTEENSNKILDYLKVNIPTRFNANSCQYEQWIDIYVNSHRDQDHYRGLSSVKDLFNIYSIWDSGETGATTQDCDYQYYMRLRRRLKDAYGEKAVYIPTPSTLAIAEFGGAKIYCLNSSEDAVLFRPEGEDIVESKVQHTNSIVLQISYAGRSLMLPSDSDWHAWGNHIVPAFSGHTMLEGDILIASHHGSRSFFTDEKKNDSIDPKANPDTTFLEALPLIQPKIVLISCGEYKQYHHPNVDALNEYKKHTPHSQVYTTNSKGTFVGCINNDGMWTVVPSRFCSRQSSSGDFEIKCTATYNGRTETISSGATICIGSQLRFSILPSGGISDPQDSVDVIWEVSNGGTGSDVSHQEIYYKDKDEVSDKYHFSRELSYSGTHLLRVRLYNRKKKIAGTKIFVVKGR